MNEAIMRFGGICLSHNPSQLKIRRKKALTSRGLLSGEERWETVEGEPDVVSGTGELFGESCREDFEKLEALCKSSSPAPLSLPYFGAFKAVLSELTLAAEPKEDHITVSFTFHACGGSSHPPISSAPFCRTSFGESLWDVAYRTDTDVHDLIALNPQIRNITELTGEERVRLY